MVKKVVCLVGLVCAGGLLAVPSHVDGTSSVVSAPQVVHQAPGIKILYLRGNVPSNAPQRFFVSDALLSELEEGDFEAFKKTLAFKALQNAVSQGKATSLLLECGNRSFVVEVDFKISRSSDSKEVMTREILVYGTSEDIPLFLQEIIQKSLIKESLSVVKIAGAVGVLGALGIGACFYRSSATETPSLVTPPPAPSTPPKGAAPGAGEGDSSVPPRRGGVDVASTFSANFVIEFANHLNTLKFESHFVGLRLLDYRGRLQSTPFQNHKQLRPGERAKPIILILTLSSAKDPLIQEYVRTLVPGQIPENAGNTIMIFVDRETIDPVDFEQEFQELKNTFNLRGIEFLYWHDRLIGGDINRMLTSGSKKYYKEMVFHVELGDDKITL